MTTPRALTVQMASMGAASSCVCSRHFLYPMMPPLAPSSCSVGECLASRSSHFLKAAGRGRAKVKDYRLNLTFKRMTFLLCCFHSKGHRQEHNFLFGVRKSEGKMKNKSLMNNNSYILEAGGFFLLKSTLLVSSLHLRFTS